MEIHPQWETLLLPGMDGTGRLFEPLLRELPDELHPRVVTYPPDRAISYDELVYQIDLPEGPFAIVAESFAGPLGVRVAARAPDRVRAIVLVASFLRSPIAIPRWCEWLAAPWLFRIGLSDGVLRWLLLGEEATTEEIERFRSAIGTVAPEVLAVRLREILSVYAVEEFARLSTPVLYLRGAADRLVGEQSLIDLQALRSDLESVTLDAPHFVLQRRPAEAAQLIADFIHRANGRP